MLWVLVAVRVLANPIAYVFQKLLTRDGVSPARIVGVTYGLLALVCLPLLLIDPPPAARVFWGSMAICALLSVAGNVLIAKAVQMTDLSVLGPINSYKPVVSLIPGIVLLNEIPSGPVLSGIALIIVGSYIIGESTGARTQTGILRLFSDRGVQYRLAALVFSATEAVFLKQSLLVSSSLPTFAVWSVLGFVLLLPWLVRPIQSAADPTAADVQRPPIQSLVTNYLWLGVTTGLMQFCTIVVLGGLQVATAMALFQTSTLVSVLLGWRIFREPAIVRRLAGAAIMTAGAMLIVLTH